MKQSESRFMSSDRLTLVALSTVLEDPRMMKLLCSLPTSTLKVTRHQLLYLMKRVQYCIFCGVSYNYDISFRFYFWVMLEKNLVQAPIKA